MTEFRNPAYKQDAPGSAASDVNRIPSKRFKNTEWTKVIQLEDKPSDTVNHGPASSDAYNSWAMPEHLRETH
ncbi:hypothetical protein [Rhizobium sp. L1K21]|uniref:hypothetical protein n=1 Tax=Rhizobium sp. L1K21 TaxID=2954933 RepID=UPI00209290F2|nr:hypothetical protein [Rhizobium sp. L1K21]MCO6185435.1 hypothetical protein [Rhizobium sp. L1K21]